MEFRSEPKQNKANAAAKSESSLRCSCGSLLARMVEAGVEIKCRRCKRQVILPFDAKGIIRMNL
jgi:phage FluMu protein Com